MTKFEWTNPHALLYVDGKDSEGKAGNWKFEMGSPGGLESRGWKRTDLKTGDRITVDGYAAKDGSNVANARTVALADGRKPSEGSSPPLVTPSVACGHPAQQGRFSAPESSAHRDATGPMTTLLDPVDHQHLDDVLVASN